GRSVIVDDLHIGRPRIAPAEADPVLVVDPDTVLPAPVALERLEPIARRHAKTGQRHGGVQLVQLPERDGTHFRGGSRPRRPRAVPPPLQRNQTGCCCLFRIRCCPRRLPWSASSRLPGGTRRPANDTAAFSWSSFRSATARTSAGQAARAAFEPRPWKRSSVP